MYDLEEQEQLDALRSWWRQYGRRVWLGLALALTLWAGYRGWLVWEQRQAQQAGVLFDAVEQALQRGELSRTAAALQSLEQEQPRNGLSSRATFLVAAMAHAKGDQPLALKTLEWGISASKEPFLRDLARLRSAGILADQQKYQEALQLVEAVELPGLKPLANDLKGDILWAQGAPAAAVQAWRSALEKLAPDDAIRQIVQEKLETQGDKVPAPGGKA